LKDKMTKFFATCDANGLIGAELNADNLSDARRELAAAIADRSCVVWIDDAQTDIEDELGIRCDGMTYYDACERLSAAGADCEVDSDTTDGWSIWSVTSE
jgi:uncharacterized NAD-dependent epimerase/dehydratase family protein